MTTTENIDPIEQKPKDGENQRKVEEPQDNQAK